MYLLDTNVVSELRRARPHGAVAAWLQSAREEDLHLSARTFRSWARLVHRKPDRLVEDAMIAATATVHRLTVVTRNVRDFDRLGVARLQPI